MTAEEVEKIVRSEAEGHLSTVSHGITLAQAIVRPKQIVLIDQIVRDGCVTDNKLSVWLVGRERTDSGYMIVMRNDDFVFGLAYGAFSAEGPPVLVGWYGDLVSTFEGM